MHETGDKGIASASHNRIMQARILFRADWLRSDAVMEESGNLGPVIGGWGRRWGMGPAMG